MYVATARLNVCAFARANLHVRANLICRVFVIVAHANADPQWRKIK